MTVLLDTHAFLWFILDDARLSQAARDTIELGTTSVLISPATPWEIAIKYSTKKLTLTEPFHVLIPREIHANRFTLLPVSIEHTVVVSSLPYHHRDPFDRMLIAQSLVDNLPVVSVDSQFDAYGVNRIW